MPTDDGDLLRLIGEFYEAATSPADLSRLGSLLREAMGVDSGIMFVAERDTGRMLHLVSASANFDTKALGDYAEHYHSINPWFAQALRRRPPYTARGEELIEQDAFDRSEFAADWCSRVGIYHMIGSTRAIAPGVVVGAGIHRQRSAGAFSDDESARYELLCGHIGRALQIAWRLNTLEGQALAGLETIHALGMGLMLLDRDARPVFLNAIAERIVGRSRWLCLRGGAVVPVNPSERPAFARLITDAAERSAGGSGGSGGLYRVGDPVEGRLSLLVAPFRSTALAFGDRTPVAVIQFSDPDARQAPGAEALEAGLGLSAAEAALVATLVRGGTLAEHAERAGISVNTAKTYLSRAFAKTGTQRQSDLIALVLSDPAVRGRVS